MSFASGPTPQFWVWVLGFGEVKDEHAFGMHDGER